MNNDKTTLYGWIAVVLGVIVIGGGILWYVNDRKEDETDSLNTRLSFYRSEIDKKCSLSPTTTAAERTECMNILTGLSNTLKAYQNVFSTSSPSTTDMQNYTTPTTTLDGEDGK